MKNEIKTIYKARYVIDIEFTDEPMPIMTDDYLKQRVNIKLESSFRDMEKDDGWRNDSNQKFDYMEKHFPEAILFLYFQMLWLECSPFSDNSLEVQKKGRSFIIDSIGKLATSRVRERMKLPKGRTPEKERALLYKDKENFREICLKEIKEKQKERKKITKTAIAESLYPRYGNPLRELRKRLELYEVSFEELIKKS
jgi:hypothetical protein